MSNASFSIKSNVELNFTNARLCEIAYNSFLPEFERLQTKRSKILMEKNIKSLTFNIESNDITAFRATISEIIGLGKIVDITLKLCK